MKPIKDPLSRAVNETNRVVTKNGSFKNTSSNMRSADKYGAIRNGLNEKGFRIVLLEISDETN